MLSAFKVVAVPLLCVCAVRLGRPPADESQEKSSVCTVVADGMNTPLIGFADEEQKQTERLQNNYELTLRNARKKNIVLAVVFTVTTAVSVYLAIKCVSFQFGSKRNEAIKGSLLAAIVLATNISFFLCRRIANELTKEEGRLVLDIHNHRITLKGKYHATGVTFATPALKKRRIDARRATLTYAKLASIEK